MGGSGKIYMDVIFCGGTVGMESCRHNLKRDIMASTRGILGETMQIRQVLQKRYLSKTSREMGNGKFPETVARWRRLPKCHGISHTKTIHFWENRPGGQLVQLLQRRNRRTSVDYSHYIPTYLGKYPPR